MLNQPPCELPLGHRRFIASVVNSLISQIASTPARLISALDRAVRARANAEVRFDLKVVAIRCLVFIELLRGRGGLRHIVLR